MASSALGEWMLMGLSSSEEVDVLSIDAGYLGDSPALSPQYEELVEVLTSAWRSLVSTCRPRSGKHSRKDKLDESFLQSESQPPRRGLTFFTDLHTEVSKSWKKPFYSRLPTVYTYSVIMRLKENSYGTMPKVEETLTPALPNKPCHVTFSLVGKASYNPFLLYVPSGN